MSATPPRDPAKAPYVDSITGDALDMAQSRLGVTALTDPNENSDSAKAAAQNAAQDIAARVQTLQGRAAQQDLDLADGRAQVARKQAELDALRKRAGVA